MFKKLASWFVMGRRAVSIAIIGAISWAISPVIAIAVLLGFRRSLRVHDVFLVVIAPGFALFSAYDTWRNIGVEEGFLLPRSLIVFIAPIALYWACFGWLMGNLIYSVIHVM